MGHKLLRHGLFYTCLFLFSINTATAASKVLWQTLKPGLEYAEVKPNANPWGHVHAFRIDLRYFRFNLAFAKDLQQTTTTVKKLARHANAALAVNGGFFSTRRQPIGLRIRDGRVIRPIKNISWWGVFYILGNSAKQARISGQRHFRHTKHVNLAIQGGPRLIINGRIPQLKSGLAERTAVGITRRKKVVLVVTHHAPMTTNKLATFMKQSAKQGGLNCRNALNLDGGGSTQLYAQINDFTLSIPGFSAITDALVVIGR